MQIKKHNESTLPWNQSFVDGGAVNWKTQKPYRGINTMLLNGGEYTTYKKLRRQLTKKRLK